MEEIESSRWLFEGRLRQGKMGCQMGWIGCAIFQATQKAIMRIQFLSYFWNPLIKQTWTRLLNPPNTFFCISIQEIQVYYACCSAQTGHQLVSTSSGKQATGPESLTIIPYIPRLWRLAKFALFDEIFCGNTSQFYHAHVLKLWHTKQNQLCQL